MLASASLRLLYSQWAHQPHSSFRFSSPSLFFPCAFSP
jgi:hypothetical protein